MDNFTMSIMVLVSTSIYMAILLLLSYIKSDRTLVIFATGFFCALLNVSLLMMQGHASDLFSIVGFNLFYVLFYLFVIAGYLTFFHKTLFLGEFGAISSLP